MQINGKSYEFVDSSIAIPSDDTALRELIAGVYEECAKVCDEGGGFVIDESAAAWCVAKIRALAEKKLASLTS